MWFPEDVGSVLAWKGGEQRAWAQIGELSPKVRPETPLQRASEGETESGGARAETREGTPGCRVQTLDLPKGCGIYQEEQDHWEVASGSGCSFSGCERLWFWGREHTEEDKTQGASRKGGGLMEAERGRHP